MFNYEVHLMCDGKNCSEMLTDVSESVDHAVKQTAQQALRLGWKRVKTKWYCTECQNERQQNSIGR